MPLSVREWICPECQPHDRDINESEEFVKICKLEYAHEQKVPEVLREFTPVKTPLSGEGKPSGYESGKQEFPSRNIFLLKKGTVNYATC
jgi:hypothetical protein